MNPKRSSRSKSYNWPLSYPHSCVPPGAQSDPRHVANARAKKRLARTNHPNANEHEAQTELRMAQAVIKQHNIDQAQLIEDKLRDQRAMRGGLNTVNIKPARGGGNVFFQTWTRDLAWAMEDYYDCYQFSTQYSSSIEWTFYGIAEHTVLAAEAFEMVHNLIQDWASTRPSFASRNSYSLGMACRVRQIAKKKKHDTEKVARDNERKVALEKARLEAWSDRRKRRLWRKRNVRKQTNSNVSGNL